MTISFVENMLCFGEKCSCLTFYDDIKMFFANKVLFTTTKEKLSELLILVMVFMRQKYKIYICYDIKECISDKHEAMANGKIFWREHSPITFHTFVTTFIHRN